MVAQGSNEFWLESLRAEGAAFREVLVSALEAGTTDVSVPSCPDWTVLDLAHHLGGVYRWVASHVNRGVTSRPDWEERTRLLKEGFPPAGETLAWWDAQQSGLLSQLEALDPAMPAWNWAPQAKVVGFWPRRMAHETAVHRWDLQMAQGLAEPIEERLAVDGVQEVLDSWLPAGRRKGPTDRFGVIQLVATDAEEDWLVRLRGEGIALLDTDTLFDDSEPHARVTAAGSASDLELALYGRVGFDVLDVSGDESLLDSLRTG